MATMKRMLAFVATLLGLINPLGMVLTRQISLELSSRRKTANQPSEGTR